MATLKRKSFERDTGLTDDKSYQEYHKQSKPWLYSSTYVSNYKIIRETKYLKFTKLERPEDKKTDVVLIESQRGEILGFIKWFGRWRQYSFFS